jgi:hypothetical protein
VYPVHCALLEFQNEDYDIRGVRALISKQALAGSSETAQTSFEPLRLPGGLLGGEEEGGEDFVNPDDLAAPPPYGAPPPPPPPSRGAPPAYGDGSATAGTGYDDGYDDDSSLNTPARQYSSNPGYGEWDDELMVQLLGQYSNRLYNLARVLLDYEVFRRVFRRVLEKP